MRKNYLLMSVFSLVLSATYAQYEQFENGGFESWDNLSLASEEPTEWSSLKTADALASQAPKVLSTDAGRTGTYSIKLQTIAAFGVPANGIITNGRVHADFDPSLGYIYTDVSDAKWNTPFSSYPDSVIGYYKYSPVSGDKGKVEVVLHTGTNAKLPENGTAGSFVAKARFNMTQAQAGWTRFSAPFGYFNGNAPQYMLAVLTCGDSTVSQPGTIAWFDDVSFVYNTITTGSIVPLTYNVTNTTGTAISIPFTVSGNAPVGNKFIAQLSDETGSFAHPTNLDTLVGTTSGTINTTIPAQTQQGSAYRVRVIATMGFQLRHVSDNGQDITINLTGTYITPDNQDIPSGIVGQGAILFTVYENPAATSREWKYADTIGAPLQSFSPVETGTTLNYNPATKGYAYIVCESHYPTDTLTSNEVEVYYGQLGIEVNKVDAQDVIVYQKDNALIITSKSDLNFAVMDALGRTLSKGNTNSGSTSVYPDKTGLYFIQFSNGKTLFTRKVVFAN